MVTKVELIEEIFCAHWFFGVLILTFGAKVLCLPENYVIANYYCYLVTVTHFSVYIQTI